MEQSVVRWQGWRRRAGNRYSASDVAQTYYFQGSETRFGWTAGAGVDGRFRLSWSVKLEYDYYGFGTRSVTFIDSITGTSVLLASNRTFRSSARVRIFTSSELQRRRRGEVRARIFCAGRRTVADDERATTDFVKP